ncbi:hypothetical protein GUITHDRAFT_154812 [Guillardia theta CCMP2712]|uniref:Cytochrome b561 domain-containing protein n=1 Tax=Guillardia theta (strain CCMP2712) TaxID=905079 RepID=L1IPR8_GUITC|nr:hypothetical protein GUITHDRAFT_154812 [Guillardia theta CCMP2712]EKX38092.1 hypothetical protein GUITHDRAFT_154812 [Guillardia theta CCMP2712]|mmetsp:Transcript_29987/g.96168  ORF Transcript_29987/g.96168 Transcript_29987/m.96168 type:complete len:203 (-) Transcript_29987:1230-1838(-)|eukprot:XP_005825072.1 hypothetical protein GUITHDRAFT_154812 [Guillardia theta CCMP2712]
MSASLATLAPAGAVLAAFFARSSKFPSSLFSWHPTLLGVGWLALTPYAIKYLRESKETTDVKEKAAKVQTHGILNGLAYAAIAGGLWAIWQNKENNAAAKKLVAKHLVSLHGKLGALTTVLGTSSLLLAAYRTTSHKTQSLYYLWRDKVHRYLGIAAYITAGMTIVSIVNAPWGKHNLGPAGQKILSAILVLYHAAVVRVCL